MRPTIHEYLMSLARMAALRTTCIRRGVGCVLVDDKGRVLSIGYNGVASGLDHCNHQNTRSTLIASEGEFPHACFGHDLPPGFDQCEAVHAEQNAIIQCRDSQRIHSAYVTLSPCKACLKLLLNTSCQRIYVAELHTDIAPIELWKKAGREWILMEVQR